jgi:hypothetical protein
VSGLSTGLGTDSGTWSGTETGTGLGSAIFTAAFVVLDKRVLSPVNFVGANQVPHRYLFRNRNGTCVTGGLGGRYHSGSRFASGFAPHPPAATSFPSVLVPVQVETKIIKVQVV